MRIKAVSSLVGGEVLAEPILTEKNDTKNEILNSTTTFGGGKVYSFI